MANNYTCPDILAAENSVDVATVKVAGERLGYMHRCQLNVLLNHLYRGNKRWVTSKYT